METLVYINEHRVKQLLDWDKVFEVVEKAIAGVAKNLAIQNARAIIKLPESNMLYAMPGYLNDNEIGAVSCKIVSYFPQNTSLPTLMANILLMDKSTGLLKAVIAGTEITSWRTAAASAVATRYLHKENNKILAIIGAGTQGKIHAICFSHLFKFQEIRIWNRRADRAEKLVAELSNKLQCSFRVCKTVESCVKDADVIVTTTGADSVILKLEWLKKGVHINAVGVSANIREIEEKVYKASHVYIDYWDGAKSELQYLTDMGVKFEGQIGDVIIGNIRPPPDGSITIFQSLGMAVEDCAMARMIYDLHMQKSN